ncbi:MAG: ATP phosphoribosyltransferase regulatory subunit [Luminiphilus sp.]|nr:ATP phosphoribosyltransferase regulatory subunit [Luminiphilus sp.]MDG2037329.1 ATP phosphoribosyltransferase regulatory subunit [Luminiphilus sp.]
MTTENRWLLPEGIEELLPERASQLEALRRRLLDQCGTWGYRYVIPPLVEFTDSLLIGLGADLDLVTCKFTDQMSGRMLGVRADITPQAARMDAHSLAENGVTRLCYAGSTLQSTPQSVIGGRAPIQLGAELFGCDAIEADSEIISLMLSTFACAGVSRALTLDIGHIGIYDALFSNANLDPEIESQMFDALQRKSTPDIERLSNSLPDDVSQRLRQLASLHGSPEVLLEARTLFSNEPVVLAALDDLDTVLAQAQQAFPDVGVYVDLTELRGFRYHTGLVFAVYLEGRGSAVAKGGRYDNIGAVFGRDRPATGFAIDLKALVDDMTPVEHSPPPIIAPPSDAPDLRAAIAGLRAKGRTVVVDLAPGLALPGAERLVLNNGEWIIEMEATS